MTSLNIIILICSISLGINIFLIWYIYNALKQIRGDQIQIYGLIEELEDLQEIIKIYVDHLKVVADMEIFYGDETLRELMRHGDTVISVFKEYHNSYSPLLERGGDINDDQNEEDFDIDPA